MPSRKKNFPKFSGSNQSGFTLMEMVIAFGLLAVVSLFAAMGIQTMVNNRASQSFVGGRNFVAQKIHNKVSNVALIAWSAANNTSVDSDGNDQMIRACVFGSESGGVSCRANTWMPFVVYETDSLSNPRPVTAPLRNPTNISRANMNRIFYNKDTMEPCDPAQISGAGTDGSAKCSIGVLTRMRATCPNGAANCSQAQSVEIGYVIRSFSRSATSGTNLDVLDQLALRDITNKSVIESKSLSLFKAQDFTVSTNALAGGCKDGEVSAGIDGYGNLICQNLQYICPPGTVTVGIDRYGRPINTSGSSGALTGAQSVSCIPVDCGTTPEGRRRIMTSLVDQSTGLVRPKCVEAPVHCAWNPGDYPKVLMDLSNGNPATAVCGELNVCTQSNSDGGSLNARNLTSDWTTNVAINPNSGIRGGVNASCETFDCGPNMYMTNWTGPNGANKCYSTVTPMPPPCPTGTSRSNSGGGHPSDSSCKCPAGNVWDVNTQSCNVPPTCPSGVYSATSLPGGSSFTINTGITCYCPATFSQNGTGMASSNYSGCKCSSSTQYISPNDGQCKTCPSGSSLRTGTPSPAGGIVAGTDNYCGCNNANEVWNAVTSKCEVMYYNRWCAREKSGNAFWTSNEVYENKSGCVHEGQTYTNGQITNWGTNGTTLTCFSSNNSIDPSFCQSNTITQCQSGQFYQITCNNFTSSTRSATAPASGYPKTFSELVEAQTEVQNFMNSSSLAANCTSSCFGAPLSSICQGGTYSTTEDIRRGSCANASSPSTHLPLPTGISTDKTIYSGSTSQVASCPANLEPGDYCLQGLLQEPQLCGRNAGSIYAFLSCSCPSGSSKNGLGSSLPAPNFNCKCNGSGESWDSSAGRCSSPTIACYFHQYVCGNACESTGVMGYFPSDTLPNGADGCGTRPQCSGSTIEPIYVNSPRAANCNSTPVTTTTTTLPPNGCNSAEDGFAQTISPPVGPVTTNLTPTGTWTAPTSGRFTLRLGYKASWDDHPVTNCIPLTVAVTLSGSKVASYDFPSSSSGCRTSNPLPGADGHEELATLSFDAIQGQTYTLQLPGDIKSDSRIIDSWASAYTFLSGSCGPANKVNRWGNLVLLSTQEESVDFKGCTAAKKNMMTCQLGEQCFQSECITSVSTVVNGQCEIKGRRCIADP